MLIKLNERETNLANQLKESDPETYFHCVRVMMYAKKMIRTAVDSGIVKYSPEQIDAICKGALFHDVGKLFVRSNILRKETSLSEDEIAQVSNHTWLGYNALKDSLDGCEHEIVKNICLYHHDRVDGMGYEHKSDLPFYVQAVSICDVFDALHSDRVYRKHLPKDECMRIIRSSHDRSGYFDEKLIDLFAVSITDIE